MNAQEIRKVAMDSAIAASATMQAFRESAQAMLTELKPVVENTNREAAKFFAALAAILAEQRR